MLTWKLLHLPYAHFISYKLNLLKRVESYYFKNILFFLLKNPKNSGEDGFSVYIQSIVFSLWPVSNGMDIFWVFFCQIVAFTVAAKWSIHSIFFQVKVS